VANEIEARTGRALAAIKEAFGTEADEFGATLFVNHHLEELPETYWTEHLGTANPDPRAVLDLISFKSSWGENDLEHFDFSLPGEVTDYVVSVRFDDAGEIDEISMES
jgi:hypothetical protein